MEKRLWGLVGAHAIRIVDPIAIPFFLMRELPLVNIFQKGPLSTVQHPQFSSGKRKCMTQGLHGWGSFRDERILQELAAAERYCKEQLTPHEFVPDDSQTSRKALYNLYPFKKCN